MLKKQVLYAVLWGVCISLLWGTCSCARERTAPEVLTVMCESVESLPAGRVYRKDAEEGEAAYLPPSLCAALYGEATPPPEMELIEDYAIYLSSFTTPFELAVFRCYAGSDTDKVAKMCLHRLQHLSEFFREGDGADVVDAASVVVMGRYVVFVVSEESERILSVVWGAIR